MSECEERLYVIFISPAVTYVKSFLVLYRKISAVISTCSVSSEVIKLYWECERKLS